MLQSNNSTDIIDWRVPSQSLLPTGQVDPEDRIRRAKSHRLQKDAMQIEAASSRAIMLRHYLSLSNRFKSHSLS